MPLTFLSPLHKAARQIGLFLEGPCAELGVGGPEAHLLSYLRGYGPCSIRELRRVFGTKRSTLTSMLDRMEQQGWISRRLRPADRRSFLVDLEPPGRRLAGRIQSLLDALEEGIAARVGDDDVAGFRAIMDAIADVTRVEVRSEIRSKEQS